MSDLIRLDKFLSNKNIASRKDVSVYIRKGRVLVDGLVQKNASTKIDPQNCKISFDGEVLSYEKYIYIMMNKPKGVLSATRDNKSNTVLQIIPQDLFRKNLFPVGRLDKDTTGLLIITNDGDFSHKVLAPKSHIYKEYKASLDIDLDEKDILDFEKGIQTGGNNFLPAVLRIDENDKKIGYVKIREGKFHQVKRMFKACGKTVIDLERLCMGELKLDKALKEGECRQMTSEDLDRIFK